MKIVVLGTRGFPGVQGGVEAHCQNLYPILVKLGCEVTVFGRAPYIKKEIASSAPSALPRNDGSYEGVRVIPLPCPKSKFLEAPIHTLIGIFAARKVKPDILHIHAIGPSLVIPIARILGFKVVMTNHGPDYRRKKWNLLARLVLRAGEWLGSCCANAIICISQTIAEDIRKKHRRGIYVIPNGVNIPQIAQGDEELRKYKLEKGKYILAVGRFVPEKGFHDLVEAFGKNGDSPQEAGTVPIFGWKLVIAGDADHEDKYSLALKEKARLNPNIVLTGFVSGETLKQLYSHAGLFVLPSYYEGLPIALLEAMSYGLSCIVSDIPANREVALSNERYFEAGDIDKLRLKMTEFLSKPLTESEKKAQIVGVSHKYNWNKIAEETLHVYENCLKK